MQHNWPNLTQADFEWKLAQLNAYCNHVALHKTVGPALELGTCVAGRLLLEFLGIKAHWQKPPYTLVKGSKKGFDINVEDFGLEMYPISTLSDNDREILLNFIIRAHRISHLTRDPEPDSYEWTCKGAPIIDRLFREHFYTKFKDKLPPE